MPLVITNQELQAQYWEPVARGPVAQADLSTWAGLGPGGAPVSIGAGLHYTSLVIASGGFVSIGVGIKLSQAGTLTIQRFLDKLGTVPVGAPITANGGTLVANVSNWATVNDGLPFASFTFDILNSGGSTAAVSNFACLLSAG